MPGGSARTTSIIRQTDIIDLTKLLQRQAVRATAAVCRPVFFFLLLLFVQYLPPFLQRDADPFGRVVQLWSRLSLHLSFSTRDVGVS